MVEVKRLLRVPFDSDLLLRKRRSVRRQLLALDEKRIPVKIAILGGSTTDTVQEFMELFLLAEGIEPVFYASEYGKYWEDGVFGNPELDAFGPDLVYVHTTMRNITEWPAPGMKAEDVDQLFEKEFAHYQTLWASLKNRFGCPVIQNNFDKPDYRILGNLDSVDSCGRSQYLLRLNMAFAEYAREHENFYIHDIDYLSARIGLGLWHDEQYWCLFKSALAMKAIPEYAYDLTRMIKAIYGKNKKALALDLDNTLWGGVVGDDGVERIAIGRETGDGETFTAVQEYLLQLKQIGVLLSINSKNDEANAIAGLNHPEGVLRPGDFVSIQANWLNKDENMRRLAKEINIGLDSFVFVDDNPAERDIVETQVPEVSVLPFSTPYESIRNLDRSGFFETLHVTDDDIHRNEMYQSNKSRRQMEESFTDYSEYLRNLSMRAQICPFKPVSIKRIAQLSNKTNQFNLTTHSYTEAEIEKLANSSKHICISGRLEDKFGDNGIVSVIIGAQEGDVLEIELWIMSCRVLKRDMELAMFDELVAKSLERGVRVIRGFYYPTAKNHMVAEFYGTLGFEKVSEDEQGNSVWEYHPADHQKRNTIITVEE